MYYTTTVRFTVYSAKEVLQCINQHGISMHCDCERSEDFNIEEKGSELIEQQRLQLKKEERPLRKRRKRDQERSAAET